MDTYGTNFRMTMTNMRTDYLATGCMKKKALVAMVVFTLILQLVPYSLNAQNDPILAGMVLTFTETAKNKYDKQLGAMALESTGHIWTAEEVEGTKNIQEIYNDYLDSFRDIVVYAAQVYGFYSEITHLIDHYDALGRVIDEHPQGIFAGALSSRRNQIYRDLIMNAVDIVNDIRIVCLSDVKMTEQQRIDMVFAIRPKLRKMNHQLMRLIRIVKYSTFTDILIEIELIERQQTDKSAITRACFARWKNNAGIR